MTSDAASGRRGLWTEPKCPGDAVRILLLKRGAEHGDVRIQQYDTYLKIAMFLPGVFDGFSEDAPKLIPGKHRTTKASDDADAVFDNYVAEAYAAGWQNYHPEQASHG